MFLINRYRIKVDRLKDKVSKMTQYPTTQLVFTLSSHLLKTKKAKAGLCSHLYQFNLKK